MPQKVNDKKDKAVSPVIGSILLVAITVMITGIIASFVFGMTGDIQKTHIIAVTVQKVDKITSEHCHCSCCAMGAVGLVFTNHGGMDIPLLKNGSDAFTVYIDGEEIAPGSMPLMNNVGSSGVYESQPERQHVVVKGNFIDGTHQVILDTWR